jgi:hypothetical protein
MRYHGRPLELTAVLLDMNHRQSNMHQETLFTTISWDQELLSRLEPG